MEDQLVSRICFPLITWEKGEGKEEEYSIERKESNKKFVYITEGMIKSFSSCFCRRRIHTKCSKKLFLIRKAIKTSKVNPETISKLKLKY